MNNRVAQNRKIHLPINQETLTTQEAFTKEVRDKCLHEPEAAHGNGWHYHKCLFAMLSNDKSEQYAQCRKWRRDHNINLPFDGMEWSDACDYCQMMCYVALDDEGKLMYAIR